MGPVSVLPDPRTEQPLPLENSAAAAPATRELVDQEVRRIMEDCDAEARTTLQEHREALERLTQALLAAETLNADAAYAAAGIPRLAGEAAAWVRPAPLRMS